MYIIANWKMNPGTKKEAEDIIREISKEISEGLCGIKRSDLFRGRTSTSKIIICPPFLYLDLIKEFSGNGRFFLGAQNLSSEKGDALTGEISAQQLVDFGVGYVIIGHSERKNYFQETDEIINKKIKIALEYNLKVIFCIGENLNEKEKGLTLDILNKQIINGLKNIKLDRNKEIIIAYEPIWAISAMKSGVIPTYNEVLKIRNEIKKILKRLNFNFPIIYGGSVDEKNIQNFIKISKMDGVLVGSKSLDPKSFIKIIKDSTLFKAKALNFYRR